MKRSHRVLRRRLDQLLNRAISSSDGPGFIYHYFDSRYQVKVGRSVNVARRRVQWDRTCPNPNRKWKPPIWCSHSHRAGKFHWNHVLNCTYAKQSRSRMYCWRCSVSIGRAVFVWLVRPMFLPSIKSLIIPGGKRHQEKFVFHDNQRLISQRVRRIIRRARGMWRFYFVYIRIFLSTPIDFKL